MNARHLTAVCDNVLASAMGSCALQAGDPKRTDVGDSIDRGLILLRLLNESGFVVSHPGWMIHNITVPTISTAARDVLIERARQVSAEGWTPEHDDEHNDRSLAAAGAAYALYASGSLRQMAEEIWPWGLETFRPGHPRRELVKAAALILAELERLDRAASRAAGDAK